MSRTTPGPWYVGVSRTGAFLVFGEGREIVAEYFTGADGELIIRAPEMAERIEQLEQRLFDDHTALFQMEGRAKRAEAQRDALVEAGELALRVFGTAPGLEPLEAAIEATKGDGS